MAFFHKMLIDQLYIAEQASDTRGSLALVLPAPSAEPEIDLDPALHSEQLAGIFVFSARTLKFTAISEAQVFVEAILLHSARRRAFIWLLDPVRITRETAPLMEIAGD